jgi:hypothetical protein
MRKGSDYSCIDYKIEALEELKITSVMEKINVHKLSEQTM